MAQPRTIYIKPMTWAGTLTFYIGSSGHGHKPSNPAADPCSRLGGYFHRTESRATAEAVARYAANGAAIVECPHFVGFEWPAIAKAEGR